MNRIALMSVAVALVAAPLGLAAAGAGSDAPATSRYSSADEALYLARFEQLTAAFKSGLGLENYEPLEPLRGAKRYRPLPSATAAQRRIDPAALAAARDYAARNRSSALLVWHDGLIEEAAYFGEMRADKTFPSRSLAKPMTAVAVGRAIRLGKIRSLDQPVADFLTEWRGDPRRSKILVRHLLDMRSGFLPQAAAITAEDILNRAYLHPRHEQVILFDYPVVDEPGVRYEYNNATSEIVSLVIERATGVRYGEFVSREILQPLGAAGGDVWVNRPGGVAHAGCCMMLPPENWLRLAMLLMDDGVWRGKRLLPQGYVREMATGTPQNPYYGLGVYVAGQYTERRGFANPERVPPAGRVLHSEPYLAKDLFLFDGNANQVVYIVPSARLIVVRVGDPPPKAAGAEWDNSALPNMLLRGLDADRKRRGVQAPEPQPR